MPPLPEPSVAFPAGWKRTPAAQRESGKFRKPGRYKSTVEWDPQERRHKTQSRYVGATSVSFPDALRGLMEEVERAGGVDLRIDHAGDHDRRSGQPIAGKREPADPGVVVYWRRAGKSYAIACDKYDDRASNLRAIAKTIEATRGIERWGAVSGEQAFRGYEALPPPGGTSATSAPIRPPRDPHDVLGVARGAPREVVEAAYKAQAKLLHPDRPGGSTEAFQELAAARAALLGGETVG